MGVSGGNRLVAFTGVIRPIRSNATDVLIGWNLVQKFGLHGCVTNVATGDLDRPHFERFLIDANVYLTPNTALGASVLACVPLASPSALMPVLSIRRFSGPVDPRYGRLTFNVC